ncbi:hypothetical protein Tco_0394996, partial [Tanacetum coccineum]
MFLIMLQTRLMRTLSNLKYLRRGRSRGGSSGTGYFQDGKISSGRKKYRGSNIGDSGNTGDGGKIVGGAIGACSSGIGNSSLVALYACMTFIYGSSWKGEMASEAKRYLVKSFKGSREMFPGEAGK